MGCTLAGRQQHTPEPVISEFREAEAKTAKGTATAKDCMDLAITKYTYYRWLKEYGGIKLDQAKRLRHGDLVGHLWRWYDVAATRRAP